ncbi:MAG: DsbA family protein [Pseudoruegeria sp.]
MQSKFTLAALAAVAVAGGAYLFTTSAPTTTGFAMAEAQTADIDTSSITDMFIGVEDAPVEIIEYASYTCPHCANFHSAVFKQLKENYIDTGKVKFTYREVYFDRFGLWASMVARCGGDMRFFGISDLLYSEQKEWTGSGDPAEIAENLKKIGLKAGLSSDELDVCMQDGAKAQTLVAWFEENAKADDVNSTPTFIVDGKKESNMNYADFSALLDEKLGE